MALARSAAHRAASFFAKEPLFALSLLVTAGVSIFSLPHLSAVRWSVISTLFSLMAVCRAWEQCQLLSRLAALALGAFKTPRRLAFAMVGVTGLLSMFITNDVALLTMVPLTLLMARASDRDPAILVILETISANVFSALTPFGNPQNLYLFSYYDIPTAEFFETMLPFGLLGAGLLIMMTLLLVRGEAYSLKPDVPTITNRRLLWGALLVFALNVLAVLRVVDYRLVLIITLVVFGLLAPRLLLRVDFYLLGTFVLFFLAVDGLTGMEQVQAFFSALLNTPQSVLLISAGLSQVISNVPAAVLLSGFTSFYRELLLGVSVGGLGTLVASLASLISYRLYAREYPSRTFMLWFSLTNLAALVVLAAVLLALD